MSGKITVDLKDRGIYDILIGHDQLGEVGHHVRELDIGTDVFIITSPQVAHLYEEAVVNSFLNNGFKAIEVHQFPDGEENKSLANWERMLGLVAHFDLGVKKNVFVVTLGGGVVGDLGGFVAASYKRGIKYVQIPTTLLANVDSAVGGKTAINFGGTKNLVGAFHQPSLVFVDLAVLKTLDQRELIAGMAEVIKYGVIEDTDLFLFLEKNYQRILDFDMEALDHIVTRSYQIKADIVCQDERDTLGIRAKLNFGHTVAHAIESASQYLKYRHGEAVAVGMLCAAEISQKLDMCSEDSVQRLADLVEKLHLPTSVEDVDVQDIMVAMRRDKKFIHGRNRFVLPTRIGAVELIEGIDEDLIEGVVRQHLNN